MVATYILLKNSQATAHQRLRFVEAVCLLQQLGKVAQIGRNFGMIRTVGGFINLEGAEHQRLRFAEAVCGLQQLGERSLATLE